MKNKKINETIKKLRLDNNLTQQDVANFLKIDRSNYSKYELGKLSINIEMLIQFSELYKVSTDFILGLED